MSQPDPGYRRSQEHEDGYLQARRELLEIRELVSVEAPLTAALCGERFDRIVFWLDTADSLLSSYQRDEEMRLSEEAQEVDVAMGLG